MKLKTVDKIKNIHFHINLSTLIFHEVSQIQKSNFAWASKIFLQAPKSGQTMCLNIPENYPVEAPTVDGVPVHLEPNLTLREYVKQVISNIETH